MTPNLQRYVDFLFRLEDTRKRLGDNSPEEDVLLNAMDGAWEALTQAEEDELERMWAEGLLPKQEGVGDE